MEIEKSNHIIRSFFGKSFSMNTRNLFGRWLRINEDLKAKEDVLLEMWNESPSVATSNTYKDWIELQRRMKDKPMKKTSVYQLWMRYAVVFLLMILSGTITYLFTTHYKLDRMAEMKEFFVPYGEPRTLVLPDGSKVWVNAGSLLLYPKDFNSTTRSVYLTGEARFEVEKNPDKPFIVKTTHLDVEALGTVFTVEAYPDIYTTSATLEEGSIRVDVKTGNLKSMILKPNEQLVYSYTEQTINIHTVDKALFGMKKDGYLIFEEASFRELMVSLQRRYNVVIHYDSKKYEGSLYNVKFSPNESIEGTLSVLKQLIGFEYKIDKNVIFIN